MYLLYQRRRRVSATEYTYVEDTNLFGCNKGWIPYLLQQSLNENASEPFPWHLDSSEITRQLEEDANTHGGNTLIIDLKPRNPKKLSLYEIRDIWGYSANGWTPLMLHLRGLLVDVDPSKRKVDRSHFSVPDSKIRHPIFSFLHVREGTVREGRIQGVWVPPRASPTNSALLWPDAFRYFASEAEKILTK